MMLTYEELEGRVAYWRELASMFQREVEHYKTIIGEYKKDLSTVAASAELYPDRRMKDIKFPVPKPVTVRYSYDPNYTVNERFETITLAEMLKRMDGRLKP